jgi:hypothetical protein
VECETPTQRRSPRVLWKVKPMRAEAEALVEQIKQSVGLLRRHL